MEKDDIKAWSSCLLLFVGAILLFKGCDWFYSYQKQKSHDAYVENTRKDSIRKAFIADSLAHDPRHQDSLRRSEAQFQAWLDSVKSVHDELIAGIMFENDSVYHTCFHDSISINDIGHLVFLTNKDVFNGEYWQCDVCRSMDIEEQLEDGEIIRKEDADDYCSHNNDW